MRTIFKLPFLFILLYQFSIQLYSQDRINYETAKEYYFKGLELQKKESLDSANYFYSLIIANGYNIKEVFIQRGVISDYRNRYHEAKFNFNRAIEIYKIDTSHIDPEFRDSNMIMSQLYGRIASLSLELGDNKDFIENIDKSINLVPEDFENYITKANYLINEDEWVNAAKELRKGLNYSPKNAEGWNLLGYIYFQNEMYTDAIQYFSKAINVDSSYSIAYKNRALTKRNLGDNSGAIKDYMELIKMDENDVSSIYTISDIYYEKGDYKFSLQIIKKALEKEPNNIKFRLREILLNKVLENFNEVINLCNNLIAHNNELGEAFYYRAIAYASKKEYIKFCNDLSSAGERGYEEAYSLIREYCN